MRLSCMKPVEEILEAAFFLSGSCAETLDDSCFPLWPPSSSAKTMRQPELLAMVTRSIVLLAYCLSSRAGAMASLFSS